MLGKHLQPEVIVGVVLMRESTFEFKVEVSEGGTWMAQSVKGSAITGS